MKEIKLNVSGMVCGGCENRVKNALKTIKGVESVIADHTTGIVKVTLNKELEERTLIEKINDLGFTVEE